MDMFLQAGYNMQKMARDLLAIWGGGTVILSPRDNDNTSLVSVAGQMRRAKGDVWVDPQMYRLDANHQVLTGHDFWRDNLSADLDVVLSELRTLNEQAESEAYVLPGAYLDSSEVANWLFTQSQVAERAADLMDNRPRIATVCLGREAVRDDSISERIVDESALWPVDGFYVVAEPPANEYLVTDPLWLSNLLSVLAGLKLSGRRVVLGYAHQQMLVAAAANIDAIASGNFKNVRSFDSGKFVVSEEESVMRQVPYYYAPGNYSEYPLSSLDLAQQANLLDKLRPAPELRNVHSDVLFGGAQPSSTSFGLASSWNHFMMCLQEQVRTTRRDTFGDTCSGILDLIDSAEAMQNDCAAGGVFPANGRGFADVANVSRSAVQLLRNNRGFVLDRVW